MTGISGTLSILRRAFGRGVFPHEMTWFLDLPGRGILMSSKTVAARLPVNPDAHVLEVGPGSGTYSVDLARRIPHGALTLLDVQQEMLDKSAARLEAAGIRGVATIRSDGGTLPFDDASFDAIVLVTVFGEIEAREAFLREAARVLKVGGVLSITEHHPDPDFEPAEVVAACVTRYGLVPSAPLGWRWAYTLNATRVAPTVG